MDDVGSHVGTLFRQWTLKMSLIADSGITMISRAYLVTLCSAF